MTTRGALGLVTLAHGLSSLSILATAPLSPFLLEGLALSLRDTFALSVVDAGRLLALAHLGGAVGRLGWGVVSDRVFATRRRPGLAINALIGAVAFSCLGLGSLLPLAVLPVLAVAVGIAAFGWVGLYLALIAEIGGPRASGLLTGLAVIFSWGGILIGPPLFGLLLDLTDGAGLSHVTPIPMAAARSPGSRQALSLRSVRRTSCCALPVDDPSGPVVKVGRAEGAVEARTLPIRHSGRRTGCMEVVRWHVCTWRISTAIAT